MYIYVAIQQSNDVAVVLEFVVYETVLNSSCLYSMYALVIIAWFSVRFKLNGQVVSKNMFFLQGLLNSTTVLEEE